MIFFKQYVFIENFCWNYKNKKENKQRTVYFTFNFVELCNMLYIQGKIYTKQKRHINKKNIYYVLKYKV